MAVKILKTEYIQIIEIHLYDLNKHKGIKCVVVVIEVNYFTSFIYSPYTILPVRIYSPLHLLSTLRSIPTHRAMTDVIFCLNYFIDITDCFQSNFPLVYLRHNIRVIIVYIVIINDNT